MSIADIRQVPVEHIGDPTLLEPLARKIFGDGQREDGWFARKLRRECVLPSRSILLTHSRDATDPEGWLGYGLVGRPPSLGRVARTAGIGLIPAWRGRGLGMSLLHGLQRAAHHDGAEELRVPASPNAVSFYARCGLSRHSTAYTLWATGVGDETVDGPPEPWESPCPGPLRSGWFRESWERTPQARRRTVRLRGGAERFDVSMEGSAQLAVRWTSKEGGTEGATAWLRALSRGTPALLHEIDAASPELPALLEHGWSVAQTTITMVATGFSTPG